MSISPSTPITGGTQTGFTSPTYTITADIAPSIAGKQWAVTAVGGTQANVDVHTVSKPFTIAFFKPIAPKALPAPNPVTGVIKSIPRNKYRRVVRKGVNCAANTPDIAYDRREWDIPAGADSYEPEDLKAMISVANGFDWQLSSGVGDTILSGIM